MWLQQTETWCTLAARQVRLLRASLMESSRSKSNNSSLDCSSLIRIQTNKPSLKCKTNCQLQGTFLLDRQGLVSQK